MNKPTIEQFEGTHWVNVDAHTFREVISESRRVLLVEADLEFLKGDTLKVHELNRDGKTKTGRYGVYWLTSVDEIGDGRVVLGFCIPSLAPWLYS